MKKLLTKNKEKLFNAQNLTGDLSKIYGDANGISGDVTGLYGDLDECEITAEDRERGIDIGELVGGEEK